MLSVVQGHFRVHNQLDQCGLKLTSPAIKAAWQRLFAVGQSPRLPPRRVRSSGGQARGKDRGAWVLGGLHSKVAFVAAVMC